jgi:hypothetical protein
MLVTFVTKTPIGPNPDDDLKSIAVKLTRPDGTMFDDIVDACRAAANATAEYVAANPDSEFAIMRGADLEADTTKAIALLQTILGPILYLCSDQPDIRNRKRPAERPVRLSPAKKRKKLKVPRGQVIWETGFTIGPRLREAERVRYVTDPDQPHNRVRPHIRKAHWHVYWTGKGRTIPILKWVHPCFINLDPDNPGTTIRNVTRPD